MFTSRNFEVFSSGEPGIFEIAAFTSARKDVWSDAASCFITEVMVAGLLIMSPILPRASADDIVFSWATSTDASPIVITISSFFICLLPFLWKSIPCLRHPDYIAGAEDDILLDPALLADFE